MTNHVRLYSCLRQIFCGTILLCSIGSLITPTFAQTKKPEIQRLSAILNESKAPADELGATDAQARRQSNAAIRLYSLGRSDLIWPLLKASSDQSARAYFIRELGRSGLSMEQLIARLEIESDPSTRQALILALGGFSSDDVSTQKQKRLVNFLLRLYRTDPDPGVHSAIDWLFRYGAEGLNPRRLDWNQGSAIRSLDKQLALSESSNRDWFVTREGQTFALIRGPVQFLMGAPAHEPGKEKTDLEAQHRESIPRSFAISTKEVTVGQFQKFLDANPEIKARAKTAGTKDPSRDGQIMKRRITSDDDPQILMTWFEAAQYCNWLSQQEGIPKDQWCYPDLKDIKEGMSLPKEYLNRIGYRMPTDAEWEYACRAGTTTSRFFGWSEELLPDYAWFTGTTFNEHPRPVGQLKPNNLGLFDTYGNVWEWIQDQWKEYKSDADGPVSVDIEDVALIVSKDHERLRRGGSYTYEADYLRSAHRSHYIPDERRDSVGFRLARTIVK